MSQGNPDCCDFTDHLSSFLQERSPIAEGQGTLLFIYSFLQLILHIQFITEEVPKYEIYLLPDVSSFSTVAFSSSKEQRSDYKALADMVVNRQTSSKNSGKKLKVTPFFSNVITNGQKCI